MNPPLQYSNARPAPVYFSYFVTIFEHFERLRLNYLSPPVFGFVGFGESVGKLKLHAF